MFRDIILWLAGVPIVVIILLHLLARRYIDRASRLVDFREFSDRTRSSGAGRPAYWLNHMPSALGSLMRHATA